MLRASLFVVATAVLVPLSLVVACNDVETTPAPDAGNRVCDPGPFVYSSPEEGSGKVVGLSEKPSTPACSADGTNLDVINRLPRGGWYREGWKVQTVGSNDTSGQGECVVITVCTCTVDDTTPAPAPEPEDAGADAAPAPAPTPSGEAHWVCG